MCCISASGKSWKRRKTTMRSAVRSASRPAMCELPGSMNPVLGSVVKNTLHLKPKRRARMRASAGSDSSERYSWSPARNTMCLPAPGPLVPWYTTRWGFCAKAGAGRHSQPATAMRIGTSLFMASIYRRKGVPPAQNANGSQRVPAARFTGAALQLDVRRTRMRVLERPAALLVALRSHQLDGLGRAPVGGDAGPPQVVQTPEDVVVPARGERQLRPGRLPPGLAIGFDDLSGGPRSQEAAFEEVLLSAQPRGRDVGARPDRRLVLQQAFEHADRRMERRPLAARRVAVPAAVRQLLLHQTGGKPPAGLAEVGADRQHVSVDARLDLAVEERGVAELPAPGAAVTHAIDRRPDPIARRIRAQVSQQLQRVHRRDPGARDEGRAAPMAIGSLQVEQARTPALRRHTLPFRGHGRVRRADEIAHDLPPD